MTKDVLLTISGMQFAMDDEDEPIEVITAGGYYKKNGKHYVIYDEVTEGLEGVTKNVIKIHKDGMDITKRGAANAHMIFEKNRKSVTYYQTPYGSLLIGIDAKKMQIKETEKNIDVKVEYALEVNYEHLADCAITMNIKSMEAEDFSLQT